MDEEISDAADPCNEANIASDVRRLTGLRVFLTGGGAGLVYTGIEVMDKYPLAGIVLVGYGCGGIMSGEGLLKPYINRKRDHQP